MRVSDSKGQAASARLRSPVPRPATQPAAEASAAHRQLTRLSARLSRQARLACAREGVEPTPTELIARLARRTGVTTPTAATLTEAAREVSDLPYDGALEKISRLDHVRARRRVILLAETILGFREKIVLFARCLASAEAAVPLPRLAHRLGVPESRVTAIEASARRKIVTAIWAEGLGDKIEPGLAAAVLARG